MDRDAAGKLSSKTVFVEAIDNDDVSNEGESLLLLPPLNIDQAAAAQGLDILERCVLTKIQIAYCTSTY